jgi:hypothetical protein
MEAAPKHDGWHCDGDEGEDEKEKGRRAREMTRERARERAGNG